MRRLLTAFLIRLFPVLALLAFVARPGPALAACDPGTWFGPIGSINVTGLPNRVVLADLNGDGHLDVVASVLDQTLYAYGNYVIVMLGDGAGGFSAPTYVPAGSRPAAVAVADFDGDGHPDLAVSNWSSATITVLHGAGDGSFPSATTLPCAPHPYELEAADLDGDHVPDLVVASNGDSTVSVILGLGGGAFATPVEYHLPDQGLGVEVGDLDGDGHPDVVATAYQAGCVVFPGNGDGTLGAGTLVATGPLAYTLKLGDVDDDGDLDLAVANSSYGGVGVLKGDGAGGFGTPTFYALGANAGGIAIADFDGDGVPDLAATSSTDNNVRLLRGQSSGGVPTGTFAPFASVTTASFPVGLASGACDGDALPDLVITSYLGARIGKLLTTCPATPPPPERPRLQSVRDVPNDEGGHVFLRWTRSSLDSAGVAPILKYRIWRRLPPETAALRIARASATDAARIVTRPAGPASASIDYWEWIGEIPAQQLAGYGYSAPTLFDSTRAGNPYTAFFVTALTANAAVFYDSNVDSGYSVDNLPPKTPDHLEGSASPTGVALAWTSSPDADVSRYRVYRGDAPAFVPDTANLVAEVPDTTCLDAGNLGGCYKVSAVDVHGNESGFVTLVVTDVTGVPGTGAARLWLAPPGPNPATSATRLRFSLSREGAVRLALYDLQGRRVRMLAGGRLAAGEHVIEWDGLDGAGGALRAGLYVLALDAEGRSLRTRIVVTR